MVFGLGYLANRLTSEREAVQADAAVAALAAAPPDTSWHAPFRRWLLILGRMTVQLVPEYIVLVLLLGAGRAWLFPTIGPEIGNHLVWVVGFAVASALGGASQTTGMLVGARALQGMFGALLAPCIVTGQRTSSVPRRMTSCWWR